MSLQVLCVCRCPHELY